MRLIRFTKIFGFLLFFVTLFFTAFFLSSSGVLAGGGAGGGAPGGGGIVPPVVPGWIVGRFFNDANGNGIRESSEELIYNGGSGCSYTGAKMPLSGLSVNISGTSYAPDACWSYTDVDDAPAYKTPSIFFIIGDITITAQLPSGWICSPGSASVCPIQKVRRNSGDLATVALPIGIQRNSISVSLSVDPPPEPLSSEPSRKLTANVIGGSGSITYRFWWNCSDPTSIVADAISACGDPADSSVGHRETQDSSNLTTPNHTYSPDTYTAKVIVERGGLFAESRMVFTVLTPTPTTGYIIGRVFNDKNANGSRDAGEASIQDVGVGCTGNGTFPIETLSDVKIEWVSGPTYFLVKPWDCNEEGPYYATSPLGVGTYEVKVIPPSGWVRTTPNVTTDVAAGQLGNPHPWFGIRQESFISGVVFLDDSGNGIPDNGEQMLISTKLPSGCGYSNEKVLLGVVVSGMGETNFSVEPEECLSDSLMPYYVSPDIKPGTYELSLTAPAGWKSTTGSKTVNVVAGDNFTATDGSWLWFGVQPLGIPQGDHQGASGSDVGSLSCNVEGWAGDPDYPAGDINVRVKKDGVVIAGPLSANQLTEPPASRPIADGWWVGNGCAGNVGDQVSCYFGKTSPISIYSSMSNGLPHLILVEAEDVNSSGVPTGVWVPLAVGDPAIAGNLKSPKTLQCRPPGRVQIERINTDGSFISGTLANVDALVTETCAEGTVCSDNPSLFSGVDPSGHGAHASELDAYNEKVGVCSYAVGSPPCTVSAFSDATCDDDAGDCNQAITVTEGEVTKVVYKYEPMLPDLITNHQSITINGTLTTGSTLNFKSTVKNQGNGSAIAGSIGRWCMDGTEAECAETANPFSQLNLSTAFGVFDPNMTSGDRTSSGWSAIVGAHTIRWCADVKGIVTESDESNNCTSQSFNVSVAPNNAPVADAGSDQNNVLTGAVVNLNGSGSSDPDGDPITYSWSFVSRPAGSTATFSNPSSVKPSFTADKAGPYNVLLTVSDGVLSDSDDIQVVVTDAPPSNFSLSCTDVVGGTDTDPPCDIVVQFSPALKAKSTPALITITGASDDVTFDVIGVFQGYPDPMGPSVSIQGFAKVFDGTVVDVADSYTTSDTSIEFKVQVSKLAANPTNKLIYTVRLRASSGGHEEIIDLRLTLKASRSGTGEE